MPKAILLRLGAATAGGYPLDLYSGEEAKVLDRARAQEPPDESFTVPLDKSGLPAPAGVTYIDLDEARPTLAAADGTTGNVLRDLGLQLHGLLERDAVGKIWAKARVAARGKRLTAGVHLRTWLDVQDPRLARLPWELMQDRGAGAKLAMEEWSTMVRFGQGSPPDLPGNDAELRVMFVMGCNPVDDLRIGWLDEQRTFLTKVCAERNAIDFEVFEAHARSQGGLKANLRGAIQSFHPHILHFVGHGRYEGADPALELYDASSGQRIGWTSQELQSWLAPFPPRVVVLNACRTSAQVADADAPIEVLSSMAGAALSAGTACVIAMQDDIAGEAAALFADGFYGALVANETIDSAVVRGRKRITDKLGFDDKNWALPVCTLSISPEDVLPSLEVIPPARRATVKAISDEQLKAFVGRRPERRSIVDPGGTASGSQVRFVLGEAEMGKSVMARLVGEWRMLLGHRVIYLDCSKATGKAMDALEVMRQIRGRDQADAPLRPQMYDSFRDFNDTVNAVLANKPNDALPSTGRDNEQPLDRKSFAERGWERLCGAFLEGLKIAARSQPLTIILDHLSRNNAGVDFDDFKLELVPRVFLPIHKGDVSNVSVIICGTDAEIIPCGLGALRDSSKGVAQLGDFMREDWELLAREFAVRVAMPTDAAEAIIKMYSEQILPKKPWKPRSFATLYRIYQDRR